MKNFSISIDGRPYLGDGPEIAAPPTGAGWSGKSPASMKAIRLGPPGAPPIQIPGTKCLRSHIDRIMRQTGYELNFATLTVTTMNAPIQESAMEPTNNIGPKHFSTSDPALSFWAEKDHFGAWCVLCQTVGYPATEAHDDQFAHFADADEIAGKLARGEDLSVGISP